ncbi:MAG: membrane-bound lytic murein transglycosylase MltF [Xanthomonadales bacterium]|nr:membrane-bound lytic murein transglycosylase MltF [Xanthomonadales bacterium]
MRQFTLKALNKGLTRTIAGVIALAFLYSGDDRPNQLEQVKQRGSLTMLTRNGASTYYLGADGPTGPEYELVREFTEYLGVELEIQAAAAFNQLSGMLQRGQGDLIAANLARTPAREEQFNFGPVYQETSMLVVYRRGMPRPRSLNDLAGRKIMVIAGSSYEEALLDAAQTVPDLAWESRSDVGMESLLLAVADGAIDATLLDSNIYKLNGHYYPRVAVGFTLPGTLPLSWAFPAGTDDSLQNEAYSFMRRTVETGRLQEIHNAFYLPENRLDRVGMFQFLRQVRDRLPNLLPLFQDIAEMHGMDWRLLAAIGYQESHWNPEASSYTGVRGVMMLTQRTANQLGIADRLNPEQSIEGGARYFLRLRDRLPARIPEPDRSWMALAAYNLGMGHLEDVRVLTQKQGGNPDAWEDVNQNLELLTQEHWHQQTRYGYARGYEARKYVENVRAYYEILIWMDTRDHPLLIAQL